MPPSENVIYFVLPVVIRLTVFGDNLAYTETTNNLLNAQAIAKAIVAEHRARFEGLRRHCLRQPYRHRASRLLQDARPDTAGPWRVLDQVPVLARHDWIRESGSEQLLWAQLFQC